MRGVCIDKPKDAMLGGVLSQLDPATVLNALRTQLVDVELPVRDGWREIVALDAAYHPGRYVRMAFVLLSDPETPPERVWPDGDLVYLHAPVRTPMSRRGRVIRLGEESVEVYRFPNDRRLRGLRRFASASLAPLLWQRWIDQSGSPDRLDASTLQRRFIRYVPELRWVIRLRAEVSRRGTSEVVKRRIAVRCAPSESCVQLAERHSALGRAFADRANVLRVPAVVGLEAKAGLLAVEWDRGDLLLDVVKQDANAIDAFVTALKMFHAAQVPDLPTLSPDRIVDSASAAVEELSSACSELTDSLTALAGELRSRLPDVRRGPVATLHNDLHLRQVLVKRGRFTFLDLERMALGDPLIDVANFAVQLSILPHRPDWGVDPAQARRWRDAFLKSWLQQSGGPLDEHHFHYLTAASFLKLAHGAMRHLRPQWRDTVHACVRLAHLELGSKCVGAAVP